MIYFVRHGQTDYNLNRMHAGQQDVKLNQNGVEQAKRTALELKDVDFDLCFCSPLVRAKQTCEEILQFHPQLELIFDERLKERCYGQLENQPIVTVESVRWKAGADDVNTKRLGIEMIMDFYQRVADFFDDVLGKWKDKTVLVVAHSGIGRMATAYFNGFPDENDFSTIKIPNASVVIFDTLTKR